MTSTTRAAGAERQAPAHGWWPLLVISSAQLMAVLDTTIMFVALPSAQHAVGLPAAAGQWIVTAYTLAFAALLLVGGRLADRLGARRTLLAGVIGFALASAFGGASVTGAMLLTARAVQGASAALLVSSTKSLLVTVYTGDEERSRAIGGPSMLQTSLRAVLSTDTGAAAAAASTANQLGSSIGAALLSTIAAAAAAAYLAAHAGATAVTGAVHGYATAMAWGAGILLVAAIPALILINAKAPAPRPRLGFTRRERRADEQCRRGRRRAGRAGRGPAAGDARARGDRGRGS